MKIVTIQCGGGALHLKTSDEELIARVQEGDRDAFSALYRRYAGKVGAQVRRQLPQKLRRRVAVSDVIQETFTTAFEKLPEFEGPHEDSFRRWLARIAELKVLRYARDHLDVAKRAAGRELSRDDRVATQQFVGRDPSPSAQAIAGETETALDRARAGLSDDDRTILRLIHDEGMAVADAAVRLDRSVGAARKLYGRAVARLAERLYGESDEE